MRVLTGIIALYWYATLAPDLQRFFGPDGLLPVETVRELEFPPDTVRDPNGPLSWGAGSYLNFATKAQDLWAFYAIGFLPLVAFAAGLFTRLAAPLALVVVLSTIHRGPPITGPVEPLLAMAMFYLAIGPSGACYSLDAWRQRHSGRKSGNLSRLAATAAPSTAWTGVVTRAFQVHLALLYACMASAKLYAGAWWMGTGVWWLLTRGDSRLVDLTWLHAHPFLVNFWSHATIATELAFALLIWLRIARPLLLGLSAVMWTLLTLVTGQLLFLPMILSANLIFVPESFLLGRGSDAERAGG